MGEGYKVNEYGEIIRDDGNYYPDIQDAIQRVVNLETEILTISIGNYWVQLASNAVPIYGNRQELIMLAFCEEYHKENEFHRLGFFTDDNSMIKIIPYSIVSTSEITQDIKTIFETVYNVNFASYSIVEDAYLINKNDTYPPPEKKSGCFVATACYGNYNAPEVLTLRAYRDENLLTTWLGTLFVKFYYFISPPLAKQIEKSEKAKQFIRKHFLKPIVDKISTK